MNLNTRFVSLVVAATVLAFAGTARADVPGRVGRIAFVEGDVQAYSDSDPQWKVAYVNQPMTSRNSIFVGDAGRAELSVGSTTLALDAGTQVDIQQLDDNTFNANVVRGRVSVQVRRLDGGDVYNVAAPDADFALLAPGRYRIDALESASAVTVFAGRASVQNDGGAVTVDAGNAMRIAVDASNPNAAPELLAAAPVAAPLDDWVVARERRYAAGQTQRYVSPNMTGYEDLDANGQWASDPDVGPVWYPTTHVREDWAPYRYGRWAYVEPWGYTWVDDAPWGFAPFHYGRWLQVGNRWGWTPGAYVQRPVYAPALVGFYGGSNFSASFAVGAGPAVGWYPLAPWQRYAPHYTQNTGYINRVNNITIVNPPPRFAGGGGRDWNRDHGGTVAPREAFASQRSISRVAMPAPRALFDRAGPGGIGDLPRPAVIPGAVRRGPEGGGGRPEFRSPREFAGRQDGGSPRSPDAGRAPGVVNGGAASQQAPGGFDRGGLPPNYRRLPDERRPAINGENARPAGGADGQFQRPAQQAPGIQNQPGFNRDANRDVNRDVNRDFNRDPNRFQRPQQPQQVQAPQQPQPLQPRAQQPDGPPATDGSRNAPRVQQPMRGDGETHGEQRQPQFQRPAGGERPNREMRNVQPLPQGQPQEGQRPQRVERPQPAPAAAPAAPRAQTAPVAPVAPAPVAQPRVQQPPGDGPRERGGNPNRGIGQDR